jgi:hypothetical protein
MCVQRLYHNRKDMRWYVVGRLLLLWWAVRLMLLAALVPVVAVYTLIAAGYLTGSLLVRTLAFPEFELGMMIQLVIV